MRYNLKKRLLSAALSAAVLGCLPSLAQGADVSEGEQPSQGEPAETPSSVSSDAESDSGRVLGKVLVYGQRKAKGEELQNAPISVSAVDSATLEALNARDLVDVGRIIPNVQLNGVSTFQGFPNFYIRGIGVSTSARSIDPAVNVVQDGMVLTFPAGALLDTFDLEGVEVLRGPQGVLFGRNASGGVVLVRSRRPGENFAGHFDIALGNANSVDIRASIEGELVPELLSARLSVTSRKNDGYFKNTEGGTFVNVPTNVNPTGVPIPNNTAAFPAADEFVVKPTLVFDFTPSTTLTLFGQYQDYDNGGSNARAYLPDSGALSSLQTSWGYFPTEDEYESNTNWDGYTKLKAWHMIGELVQEIGGDHTLTVLAARREVDYRSSVDVDGGPYNTTLFEATKETNEQSSLEVRFNGTLTSSLDYTIGAFYLESDTVVSDGISVRNPAFADPIKLTHFFDQALTSYAIFGNLDYALTDKLSISGGLRYSNDSKDISVVPLTSCGFSYATCPTARTSDSKSWDDVSPRLILSYAASDDLMYYASYSRGFRSGNYNTRTAGSLPATVAADPEFVSAYEVGLKSEWWGNRALVNIAGFYQDYSDIQRIVQGTANGIVVQTLFNAASAKVMGLELEASAELFEGFRLDGSVGYTNAEYEEFTGLGLPAGFDVRQLKFDRVPEWTSAIAASYSRPIRSTGGELSARVSYAWRDGVFTDVRNTPELFQPSYGLTDANLTYSHGAWTASIYGRNLFDKEFADTRALGASYVAYGGQPRTYGVRLGVDF